MKKIKFSPAYNYFACFIIVGLSVSLLGPALPQLVENTHSSLDNISILFTAGSLGFLIASLGVGHVFDKLNGHQLMAGALVLIMGLLFVIPSTTHLWILVVIMILKGISQGILEIGGNILLIWRYQEKVGPYINGLHFSFGIGALLSPVLIAQSLSLSGNIHWAFWVIPIVIAPVVFSILSQPSPKLVKIETAKSDSKTDYTLVLYVTFFYFL